MREEQLILKELKKQLPWADVREGEGVEVRVPWTRLAEKIGLEGHYIIGIVKSDGWNLYKEFDVLDMDVEDTEDWQECVERAVKYANKWRDDLYKLASEMKKGVHHD